MDPDRIPPMVKDYYWDKQNCPIPYTEASMHFKRKTYKGSADEIMYAPNIVTCLSVCPTPLTLLAAFTLQNSRKQTTHGPSGDRGGGRGPLRTVEALPDESLAG